MLLSNVCLTSDCLTSVCLVFQGQSHQAALPTAALTRQAAVAVSVGTYWLWELTATLRSAFCRRGLLHSARRFGAHRGRKGAGHIVAAACLQLVYFLMN